MFFAFRNRITERTPQWAGLVIDVPYKAQRHSNHFNQSLGRQSSTTALDPQKRLLSDLRGYGLQMVLTLKMISRICFLNKHNQHRPEI
jgi:hypothetical protein